MMKKLCVASQIWVLLAAFTIIGGCAGRQAFDEGRALIESGGNIEQGLARVQDASRAEPGNEEYRDYYLRHRAVAVERYLARAENARSMNLFNEAEDAYQRALALDPINARARTGIEIVRMERRHRALLAEAEDLLKKDDANAAYARATAVLAENSNHREAQALIRRIEEQRSKTAIARPQLSAALRRPITLEFRDASLRSIFELIAKNTGLNFIFDRDVKPDLRTTVFVRNTTIEDVIRFVLVTNELESKVLNENTLLIYPNTPAKTRDYKDLVVRSFYLANADVKQTASMIRAVVKTKDLYIDERLNLLVIRDTPEAVRMAERLIAAQDLAEPEVMLEVEVMEVASSLLSELGIRWPSQVDYRLGGTAGTPGIVSLPGSSRLTVSDPLLTINLRNQLTKGNLLANPRIRVKNKEKAKIHIGDKVPVFTATTTATGFVADSVNYLDVGIKLEVEPLIYLENEVAIKVGLEVSTLGLEIRSPSGTLANRIGTRNASTTLRLKDGETQILAGLISDDDRRVADRVPGLGELPIIGRLFSSHADRREKSEIILLITPRIVRNLRRPDIRIEEFPSGTEAGIGAAPLTLPSAPIGAADGIVLSPSMLSTAPPAVPGTARFTLQAPAQVAAGQEFTLQLNMDAETAIRNGVLVFVFDPSRLRFVRAEPGDLLSPASGEVALHASAPENSGRLDLSFAGKTDIRGKGGAAKLVFQVVATASGSSSVKLESSSVTDANARVLPAQPLPAPVTLAITR